MGLNLGKLDNANKIDFIHVINRSATYTHLEDSRDGTDGGLHFINASIVRLIQMFECLDHILELLDAIVQHLLLLPEAPSSATILTLNLSYVTAVTACSSLNTHLNLNK